MSEHKAKGFGFYGELKSLASDIARAVSVARHCIDVLRSAAETGEVVPPETVAKLLAEAAAALDDISTL